MAQNSSIDLVNLTKPALTPIGKVYKELVQHYYDSLRDGLLQSSPGKYVLVEESRTANVFDSEKDAYCGATQPGVVFVTKVGDEDNYRRSKAKMKKNKPRVDINFGGSATPRLTIQGHFVSTLDGSCTPNHRIGYDSGADGGSIYDDSATNNVIAPCLPAFLKTQININGVEVDAVAAKMVLNGMQIPEVFEVDIDTDWSAYGNEQAVCFDHFASIRDRIFICESAGELTYASTCDVTFRIIMGGFPSAQLQRVGVCGDLLHLGTWDPQQACMQNTLGNDVWECHLKLPKNTTFSYKFVAFTSTGIVWEREQAAGDRFGSTCGGAVFSHIWNQ